MKANTGKNQSHLKQVDFDNERLNAVGVELMTLSELRARVNPDQLAAPEKVSFHIIFLVTYGVGVHTVDLHTHPLKASSIVSIRPGQVHQWQPNAPYEGLLLIFHPLALNHAINFEDWPCCKHQGKIRTQLVAIAAFTRKL